MRDNYKLISRFTANKNYQIYYLY